MIVRDFKLIQRTTKSVIAEASTSPYYVARFPSIEISAITAPYVNNWFQGVPGQLDVCYMGISAYHFEGNRFNILKPRDYEALYNPDKFFIEKNRVPGNAKIYEGDDYYWAYKKDIPSDKPVVMNYYPAQYKDARHLNQYLCILMNKYSNVEKVELPEVLEVQCSDDFVMFRKPDFRRVKSISLAE